jgi:RNA polymerase sigma-70 factor, ECF subfamily
MTDQALLDRILHKDTGALSELYDKYARLVFSLASSVLGDTVLAEEVVQDVFMTIWTKAASFSSDKGSFATWISRVTRNRAIDELRRSNARLDGRSLVWDEVFLERTGELSLEPALISRQQTDRLVDALKQLPVDQRRVLELAYFQGLSQQHIAEVLNEPLGTVKTRLRLGLQKLRGAMDG